MSCVVIAPREMTETFGFPEQVVHEVHDNIFKVAGKMSRLIVVAPRFLDDFAFEIANKVPTVFVLTSFIDVVHLQMHLRSGVLYLTAYDGIALADAVPSDQISASWVNQFNVPMEQLISWSGQSELAPLHPIPELFATVPKMSLVDLASQMRDLSLAQYDVVLANSPDCTGMVGTVANLNNVALTQVEDLPPDVLCAEVSALPQLLDSYPNAPMIICPIVLSDDTQAEAAHLQITSATQRPVHLLRAIFGLKSTTGQTPACFVYGMG